MRFVEHEWVCLLYRLVERERVAVPFKWYYNAQCIFRLVEFEFRQNSVTFCTYIAFEGGKCMVWIHMHMLHSSYVNCWRVSTYLMLMGWNEGNYDVLCKRCTNALTFLTTWCSNAYECCVIPLRVPPQYHRC